MEKQGIAAGKSKKQYLRFVAGFLGIVIFVVAGYFALRFYFRNEEFIKKQKQDQEIIEYYAALEKKVKEDTYGGETPEETLRLFIDALKAGDTDLAAKYFVVEEQEELNKELSMLLQPQIQNLIANISIAKKNNKNTEEGRAIFEYTKTVQSGFIEIDGKRIDVASGDYLQTVILTKNPNNRWKILEL